MTDIDHEYTPEQIIGQYIATALHMGITYGRSPAPERQWVAQAARFMVRDMAEQGYAITKRADGPSVRPARNVLAEAFIRGLERGAEQPHLAGDGDEMYQAFRDWFDHVGDEQTLYREVVTALCRSGNHKPCAGHCDAPGHEWWCVCDCHAETEGPNG